MKKKSRKFSPLRLTLIILLLAVFLYSGYQLIAILMEYRESEVAYESMSNSYVQPVTQRPKPTPKPDPDASESTLPPEVQPGQTLPAPTEPQETVPLEYAPIAVDFEALLEDCPDAIAWLYCPDTPINYPIVRAENNTYYLYRMADQSYNSGGAIFMDFRNSGDFSNLNSIVYGHNMNNGSMFGTLEKYKKQSYYDAHPVFYLLTPAQDYKIELFSGYTTTGGSADTYGFPDTWEELQLLVENAKAESTFTCDVSVGENDQIITLSTCAYEFDGARYVLVGVLRPLA